MKENFPLCLRLLTAPGREGGYVNDPRDPGGATNKGVTLTTFRRFYGRDKTIRDLKQITDEQLQAIYRAGYWDACLGDDLPAGLDHAVFDAGVNSGPSRGLRWLHEALLVHVDGKGGTALLQAAKAAPPAATVIRMQTIRMAFLRSLKTFPTFGRGWTRRVNEVQSEALAMIEGQHVDEPGAESSAEREDDFDVLRIGMSGDGVRRMQEALVVEDGTFGPATEEMVKAFQRVNGLYVDGIVGLVTARALGLVP